MGMLLNLRHYGRSEWLGLLHNEYPLVRHYMSNFIRPGLAVAMIANFIAVTSNYAQEKPLTTHPMKTKTEIRKIAGQDVQLSAEKRSNGVELHVVILRDTDSPPIRYDEIILQTIDDQGNALSAVASNPAQKVFVHFSTNGVLFRAIGVYSIVLKKDRTLSNVTLSHSGEKHTFHFEKRR